MSRSMGGCLLLALCAFVAVPSVVLSATPAKPNADAAQFETYAKPDGATYFALSLMPQAPLAPAASNDVVVLFDTSASQMGPYREKALESLRGVLATLADGDRVHLMAVDLNAIPLTKTFVAPRGAEMQAALGKLEQRVPLGSTDLEAALNAVNDAYKAAPANARAAIYIGDGQSNANLTGVDVPALVDRLVKNRVAIHSFAVGPNQNVAALAALANQTGGVVMVDGNKITGKEAGSQLTHALHEPIIWPTERVLPGALTEVYPANTPPLRTDRDTVLVGKGAPSSDFAVQIKGESNGKPVDLKWNVKPAKADDENAYLAQVVDFAKTDGGYSLPTVGSEGLAEVRRSLNMGAHALAQLGRQAAVGGNLEQAKQFVNEAVRRDPNDPTALVMKASLENGTFDRGNAQLTAAQLPAGNSLPPEPRDGDLLNSVEASDRLIQQKVVTETEVRLRRIRDQMLNDPGAAINDLTLLLDSVLRVPQLTSDQRADLRNHISSLLQQATQRRLVKEIADVQYQQNLAAARERQRLLNAIERKETQLTGLINRFNSLMDDGYRNFDQLTNEQMRSAAREAAEEFRRVDVNPWGRENVASVTAPQFAEFSIYNIENNAVREAAERNYMDTLHLVDISHIPFPDSPPIVYPDVAFWRKITRDRKKFASVDLASTSETEQKILEELGKKTDLEFVEQPLKDALTYIADKHKIDIQYDAIALRDAAIDPTAMPVSLNVHGITLRSALKLILSQNQLTYIIQDEVLQITTVDKANTTLTTKVYPVADLVLPIVAINNQQQGGFGMNGGIGGGQQGGGGGFGGGGGGFGGGGGGFGGGGGGLFGGGGGFNVQDDTSVPVPPAKSGGSLAVGDDLKLSPSKPSEAKPATVPTSVKLPAANAASQPKPTASASAKPADAAIEKIVIKTDVPAEKFWNDYFVGLSKPDEKNSAEMASKRNASVRKAAKDLMNEQKFDQVTALIRGALRNGYTQPWMYEALALAMQADNQPKEEIERALMSAVDLAKTPSDLMNVGIYMARIGLDTRALKLLRQASDMEPLRHEPYMHGLRIAERLKDSDGIRWACIGVLSQAWPADKKDIVDSARFASDALLEKLRTEGNTAQADDFRKALDAAQVRDCLVRVTWTGNADIDITVEEPSGATCSARNPRTAGGGLLVGDSYAKAKATDKANAEYTQEYMLPKGFNGQYKMLLRRLWGQVATGKATVDVYTHFGAPNQVHVRKQIPVSELDALVTFDLADGRRTEPLAQVQLAAAASSQVAINQTILAQQLNAIDNRSGTSDGNGVIGAPGTNGDVINIGGFPFFRRGAVGYQPQITTLPEGAQMNGVTAVISADRRYVRIGIPQNGLVFSNIGPVNTFNFATGGGGATP